MGLYGDHNQPALWRQVFGTAASGEQALAGGKPPAKSALSQARARLGPRPLRHLFRNAARPPALPASRDTPASGLYKGRRVLALDGQQLAIPDTPANAAAFGRHSTTRDGVRIDAGYPQIHTLRLIETGTRMNIEAIIKPCKHAEYPCAAPLLRKANRDDLILAWRPSAPKAPAEATPPTSEPCGSSTTRSTTPTVRAIRSLTGSSPRCWTRHDIPCSN